MKRMFLFTLALAMSFLVLGPVQVALCDAPEVPTLLPVILEENGALTVEWTCNDPDVVGYNFYQRYEGETWEPPVFTNITSMHLSASAMYPYNTTYYFYVQAVGSDPAHYLSEPSAIQSVYVGSFIPSPPTDLKCLSAGSNQVELQWKDNCPWPNSTVIYYKNHNTSDYHLFVEAAVDKTSAVISGLEPSTYYDFSAKAQSTHGASNFSDAITVFTGNSNFAILNPNLGTDLEQVSLTAPAGLTAQAQSSKLIQLQWTDGCNGESGFKIMRQDGVNGTMSELAITDANATGYADYAVESGHTYTYEVCAIYSKGDSGYSNTASATAEDSSTGMKSIEMRFQVGVPQFTLNGNPVAMDAAPIAMEGRVLLPIRYVVEALGGTASWISNTAIIFCNGHVLNLWLGQNTASVDGASTMIDPGNAAVTPVESNGRILLPLRFVSENISCGANWTGSEAVITYPAATT